MSDDSREKERRTRPSPDVVTDRFANPDDVPDTYEAMEQAKRGSLFGRVNQAFQDVLHNSRGGGQREPVQELGDEPHVSADDLAIRRAKSIKTQKMIVPEGVLIDGSLSSGSETDIAGRIDGDVTVDGRLLLESSALVSGNVRAVACRIDGLVEGKVECSQELDLGPTGRLNADVLAGKRTNVAGQIHGSIASGGTVRLSATAKVTGDIRARALIIEEGAVFNGTCAMRSVSQRSESK